MRAVETLAEPLAEDARVASHQNTIDAVLATSRVLVAVAARSLAEIADEVTLPQYRALVVLASKGPQNVACLAEALNVTPPTATRMCDRLVKKGLISRRTDRDDRREVKIALKKSGRDLVAEVTRRRRLEIANLLDKLSLADQSSLVSLLNALATAAGEVPDQDWAVGWEL